MINDDIEFLPQDSFFICMGDDGKPVFGVVERDWDNGAYRGLIKYKGERYRSYHENKDAAAHLLKDYFFKKNPELADHKSVMERLAQELANVMQKEHQDKVELVSYMGMDATVRIYNGQKHYNVNPLQVTIKALVTEPNPESLDRKVVEMTMYKDRSLGGFEFYSKVL